MERTVTKILTPFNIKHDCDLLKILQDRLPNASIVLTRNHSLYFELYKGDDEAFSFPITKTKYNLTDDEVRTFKESSIDEIVLLVIDHLEIAILENNLIDCKYVLIYGGSEIVETQTKNYIKHFASFLKII